MQIEAIFILEQDNKVVFDDKIKNGSRFFYGITTFILIIYSILYFAFGHIGDPNNPLFFPLLSSQFEMETVHKIIEGGFFMVLMCFIIEIFSTIIEITNISTYVFLYNRMINKYKIKLDQIKIEINKLLSE